MFVYVFDDRDADTLFQMGLTLIHYDYYNRIYTFERPDGAVEIPCRHVFGSTLTFTM